MHATHPFVLADHVLHTVAAAVCHSCQWFHRWSRDQDCNPERVPDAWAALL